jgi:hypothetical protein
MKETNLVAFGCSWTYGLGLDDNYNETNPRLPGAFCSKFAWPQVMANKLNWTCDNKGIPAASNLQILIEVLGYDYKPNDQVAVMWSYTDRDLLLGDDGTDTQIASWMLDDFFKELLRNALGFTQGKFTLKNEMHSISKKFFEVHTSDDLERRSWLYQYIAGLHLNSLNVPFVFITDWTNTNTLPKGVIDFSANKGEGFRDLDIDKAKNGAHPGIESQKIFANLILDLSGWK